MRIISISVFSVVRVLGRLSGLLGANPSTGTVLCIVPRSSLIEYPEHIVRSIHPQYTKSYPLYEPDTGNSSCREALGWVCKLLNKIREFNLTVVIYSRINHMEQCITKIGVTCVNNGNVLLVNIEHLSREVTCNFRLYLKKGRTSVEPSW